MSPSGAATQAAADRLLLALSSLSKHADAKDRLTDGLFDQFKFGSLLGHLQKEEDRMKAKLGTLLLLSTRWSTGGSATRPTKPQPGRRQSHLASGRQGDRREQREVLHATSTGTIGSPASSSPKVTAARGFEEPYVHG